MAFRAQRLTQGSTSITQVLPPEIQQHRPFQLLAVQHLQVQTPLEEIGVLPIILTGVVSYILIGNLLVLIYAVRIL